MQKFVGALVICTLLLPVLVGCPGGTDANLPDLVPVTGTVTVDGAPVSGVTVTFIPTGTTA
ncbi:MAG: hypothetical protein ACYC6Y_31660, partial [Thermoguttaceae bacterium]